MPPAAFGGGQCITALAKIGRLDYKQRSCLETAAVFFFRGGFKCKGGATAGAPTWEAFQGGETWVKTRPPPPRKSVEKSSNVALPLPQRTYTRAHADESEGDVSFSFNLCARETGAERFCFVFKAETRTKVTRRRVIPSFHERRRWGAGKKE